MKFFADTMGPLKSRLIRIPPTQIWSSPSVVPSELCRTRSVVRVVLGAVVPLHLLVLAEVLVHRVLLEGLVAADDVLLADLGALDVLLVDLGALVQVAAPPLLHTAQLRSPSLLRHRMI